MKTIDVVCAEFNKELVEGLYAEAAQAFTDCKNQHTQKDQNSWWSDLELKKWWVPGVGEIPFTVDGLFRHKKSQAILALGACIKGQTGHYDFLCGFLQKALWDLQKTYTSPLVFSILMLENRSDAQKRMNRGAEGINSLIRMIELSKSLTKKEL